MNVERLPLLLIYRLSILDVLNRVNIADLLSHHIKSRE